MKIFLIKERLKYIRKEKRLTLTQVCKATGVPVSTIVRWESENCVPNINKLSMLARFYGASLDSLISKIDNLNIKKNSLISTRLKAMREERGLTLTQVYKATGISVSTIFNWELENNVPNIYQFSMLAKFYDVSLDYLTSRTDNQKILYVCNDLSSYKENPKINTQKILILKRLRDMREERKLSRSKLSELTEIKKSTIESWEKDGSLPHIDKAKTLAEFYRVSLDYIACRTDNPEINKETPKDNSKINK